MHRRRLQQKVALHPAPSQCLDDNGFANADMDPVPFRHRTWSWYDVGGFWVSEGFQIPILQTAGSLVANGLGPGMAMGAVVVGNVLAMIPCALTGYAGAATGLNYPVLNRSSWGLQGAKLAVAIRAVVAVFWYGIQISTGYERSPVAYVFAFSGLTGAQGVVRVQDAGCHLALAALKNPEPSPGFIKHHVGGPPLFLYFLDSDPAVSLRPCLSVTVAFQGESPDHASGRPGFIHLECSRGPGVRTRVPSKHQNHHGVFRGICLLLLCELGHWARSHVCREHERFLPLLEEPPTHSLGPGYPDAGLFDAHGFLRGDDVFRVGSDLRPPKARVESAEYRGHVPQPGSAILAIIPGSASSQFHQKDRPGL